MNLFKTTLISVIVMGLASANIAAMNQQDTEQESNINNPENAKQKQVYVYNACGNTMVAILNGYGAILAFAGLCVTLETMEMAGKTLSRCLSAGNADCLVSIAGLTGGIALSVPLAYITYKLGITGITKLLKAIDQINVDQWIDQ